MTRNWKDVWSSRTLDRNRTSVLERLMAADGLDTGFGNVTEEAWREFSLGVADRVGAKAGTRVYEVGCGAGAFLLPWHERGCAVGGLDQSPALIAFASEAMPGGEWMVADATAVPTDRRAEVVLACGVFMYFPDHAYARDVLAKMIAKSAGHLLVLDVPDRERQDAAMAFRRGSLGEAEYEEKYRGLDHLFFDRLWMRDTLGALGASDVEIEDQRVRGYQNAQFRFNVFARV
ncbi:MAG TPA: methyltransferase domain-containing protein [Vicinamibacterales bacterium]|nr:methyltransferase domain-containing protein [Vicinamibacterales bacterium]